MLAGLPSFHLCVIVSVPPIFKVFFTFTAVVLKECVLNYFVVALTV
jgi:hypothetical protein